MVLRVPPSRIIISVLVLLGTATLLQAQSQKLDSLNELSGLPPASVATEHIDRINRLAYELRVSYPAAAMQGAQRALVLSRENEYAVGQCDAHVTLGLLYWLSPEFEKSLDHALRALHLSDSSNYTVGAMEANLLLGLVYNELSDFEKAEAFTRRGLDLALRVGHVEGTARAYNTLGNHYRRKKQGKEALEFYQKGLDFLAGRNMAIKNLLLNNVALYYIGHDIEHEKTRQYLDEALQIALKFENKSAEILTHSRMGAFYTNVNDYKRAEDHYRKVEKLSKELGNQSALLDVYKGMTAIKSKLGRVEESQQYENKYLKLKDSLFTLDNARQVAKMETRFETEKKEQQIKILEQQAVIRNMWTNVLIGSILVFAAFGFYIVHLQRSRTRKAKELLETQELLNKKLTEVDSIKSAFFARISHEFRTPLTLILVPLEDEINKRQGQEKEALLLIKRNASRLLELVNQLLDLSRLEAGKMELQLEAGDMHALLKMLAASFDSLAQYKQISFEKSVDIHSGPLWFDKDKVEKIVTNLLANAFKFTHAEGHVTFEARLTQVASETKLVMKVADTGKGISPEEQQLVFSSFYRVNDGTSEGTGLGLSLVKELVRFYGGTIELKSQVNSGSEFTVELPIQHADSLGHEVEKWVGRLPSPGTEPVQSETVEFDSEGGKESVLVVEDNAELRNYICSILVKHYNVITAGDGAAAFAIAVEAIPDLILSDLMMPVLDGLQLTDKLKKNEHTSHIPVILLTAKHDHSSRLQGLTTGADDYLTKPFSRDELLVRISNLIHQRKLLAERFRERILVPASATNEVSLDDRFLNNLRLIVESNMSDPSFTVEQLADKAGLQRNQLLRKLKGLTGLSPTDFIKDLRLKRAADMIRQRTDTITQIGYAVGFNDQSYFSKCFKQQFGVSPKEYARAHIREKSNT